MAKNLVSFHIFALQKHNKPMKLLFLTIVLLLVAVVLLGVKALFVKGGKFPSGHVKDIPALRQKHIGCAAHSDDD